MTRINDRCNTNNIMCVIQPLTHLGYRKILEEAPIHAVLLEDSEWVSILDAIAILQVCDVSISSNFKR